jgi:transposase
MTRYSNNIKRKAFMMLGLNPNKKYLQMPKVKRSLCSVASQLGIKSYNTLKKWTIGCKLRTQKVKPKETRRRKNKLSKQQRELVHGFIVFLQSHYLSITRNKVYKFIKTQINNTISKWWVTRFLKSLGGYKRRRAVTRTTKRLLTNIWKIVALLS